MQSGGMNYKKAFSTSFNMIFDELPGMKKKYDILKVPQYLSNDFADIARRRLNFTLNSELCGKNYKYQIFYYDNGRVFRDYYKDEKSVLMNIIIFIFHTEGCLIKQTVATAFI